jgi:16S rRNA (cytosine967-C5)-methyltransferase
VLAERVKGGLDRLDAVVLDVLRLGVYQLQEMRSVPSYAAVSQSVELVRVAGAARASGLVNGVLQAVRREGEGVEFPSFESDPVAHLSSWGSHPRWLVERWVARWGAEEARSLIEANNQRPDSFLRPVGLSTSEALRRLAENGLAGESVEGFPDSIRLIGDSSPAAALAVVPSVIQDPAAAMVVRYAELPEGELVLDLSAAPGGKTVGLAERAGYVVAADLSPSRIRRVRANAVRTGMGDRVGLAVADGRWPPFAPVPAVLLDAPCAGTGTFRRHVDGRWRIGEDDLRSLAGLQRELIDSAAALVRPGGLLVYSTCSIEPEENEVQIETFLQRDRRFSLEAPGRPLDGTMLDCGLLRVLPQRHGVDGAFAARLRRTD